MRTAIWVVVVALAIEALVFGNDTALIIGLVFAMIGIVIERKWQ